ncbi:MAG: glutamate--tRNA ligase family protein [Pseudomonadota bacterium]
MNSPVGRLAPSPTGLLHLGHARTFLLAFWHIRARAGRLLLRMEDLDGPRAEMRFADAARADLEWLGLDWDGPELVQSSELPRLNAALTALIDAGKAYPCVCSRGDIRSAQSAPHAGSPEARYPGTCRGRYASFAQAERESGRAAGARLLVPEGSVLIEDGVAGASAWDVARDVGDFLIAKRDKAPRLPARCGGRRPRAGRQRGAARRGFTAQCGPANGTCKTRSAWLTPPGSTCRS